jgi:hypothetical protein
MRPEAMALFGLQESWRFRATAGSGSSVVVHLPDELPIQGNKLAGLTGQSGIRPSSAVFAAAVSWALSDERLEGVCLRASGGDGLRIETQLAAGQSTPGGQVFEAHDALTAQGKRRLCEALLALRARLRASI